MFGKSPIEKAFFKDMLANGIPVIEEANLDVIFDCLLKASADLGFFDVSFTDQGLSFLNLDGVHCLTVKKEDIENESKFMFYTPDYNTAMENASIVGRILFLIVTFCSSEKWILYISENTEQTFNVTSEFI